MRMQIGYSDSTRMVGLMLAFLMSASTAVSDPEEGCVAPACRVKYLVEHVSRLRRWTPLAASYLALGILTQG